MRRSISLFILVLITFCRASSLPKEIQVQSNSNVETIAIIFSLASNGSSSWPINEIQPVRSDAREVFKSYNEHEAVKIAEDLIENGLWLDGMIGVVLHCSPFPEGVYIHEIEENLYIRASKIDDAVNGKILIEDFIKAVNRFYIETNVEGFLIKHENSYTGMLKEVESNLPDNNFINFLENYYGKENASYTLIPSPIIHKGQGFGNRISTEKGLKVYNTFAPLIFATDTTTYKFGFDDANQINELSAHEFGHSFVNPISNLPQNHEKIDSSSYLYEQIKELVKYGSWITTVNEHIIRTVEIRLSIQLSDEKRANRLRNFHTYKRGFVFIPEIETKLIEYENNRDNYNSLEDYYPILLEAFSEIDSTQMMLKLGKGPLSEVAFVVHSKLISDTSKVYIAGNHDDLGQWDPGKTVLSNNSNSDWTRRFSFHDGEHIEYKITRGNWDNQAIANDGSSLGNSILNVNGDTTIVIEIEKWKDQLN